MMPRLIEQRFTGNQIFLDVAQNHTFDIKSSRVIP
jgi:hypothetical protein